MKPLVIDFVPRAPATARMRWLIGVAGALLAIAGATTWLTTGPVEASHMVQRQPLSLPSSEAVQSVDQAIRELNLPWPAVLSTLADHFGAPHDAVLLQAEADIQRATLRLTGMVRTHAAVQALPKRLRNAPMIADATLLGEEDGEDTAWPVHFTLKVRLQESP